MPRGTRCCWSVEMVGSWPSTTAATTRDAPCTRESSTTPRWSAGVTAAPSGSPTAPSSAARRPRPSCGTRYVSRTGACRCGPSAESRSGARTPGVAADARAAQVVGSRVDWQAMVVSERAFTAVDEELDDATSAEQVEAAIFTAMADPAQPRLVFQPVVDLHSGAVVGHETLSRFVSPLSVPRRRWFAEASRLGVGARLQADIARRAIARLP